METPATPAAPPVRIAAEKVIEQKMLKAALVVTVAFVATASVGGIRVYAQAAQGSNVVVEPEGSADTSVLSMGRDITRH